MLQIAFETLEFQTDVSFSSDLSICQAKQYQNCGGKLADRCRGKSVSQLGDNRRRAVLKSERCIISSRTAAFVQVMHLPTIVPKGPISLPDDTKTRAATRDRRAHSRVAASFARSCAFPSPFRTAFDQSGCQTTPRPTSYSTILLLKV